MSEEEKFEKGCEHFDNEEYFEAHEVWEELWMEASGPRHAFLQGIIQTSVALHHARNNNFSGARKLLARALGYLEKGQSESGDVELDKLKDCILDFANAMERNETLPFFRLPRSQKG